MLLENKEIPHTISPETGRDLTIYSHLMDAALKAKAASLMPHFGEVNEKTVVVSVGSGTAQVEGYIAGELRTKVYAVDLSQDMLDLAAKNLGKIKLVHDDATVLEKIPANSVDVMYHSTIGHEIQSFRGQEGLEESLAASFRSLKSGGREIWRDFVKPPEGEVFLDILINDGVNDVEKATTDGFLNYSLLSTRKLFDCFYEQFKGGHAFEYKIVNHQGRELIKLPAKYAQEFILRKDYTANWRQEIAEEYTYWTPDEARTAFEQAGFTQVEVVNDDNEYIRANRINGKIALYKENETGQLETVEFMTHMVIVGHKVTEESVSQESKEIEAVDFEKLLKTVVLEDGLIRIDDKKINIGGYVGEGRHKQVYIYDDGKNDKVVKIVRSDDKTILYSAFSSFQQSIDRQQILENMGVKFMRIYDYDKKGPPYRYLIQEKVPEGSVCAADLITSGDINETDIKQMAEVINNFENGKEWQFDTNPYNWFRVTKNGKTEMTYIGGTVYRYNEAWSFDKVGLLQWTDASYINKGENQSARLPNQTELVNFANNWQQLDTKLALWWKKYLNLNLQPKNLAVEKIY